MEEERPELERVLLPTDEEREELLLLPIDDEREELPADEERDTVLLPAELPVLLAAEEPELLVADALVLATLRTAVPADLEALEGLALKRDVEAADAPVPFIATEERDAPMPPVRLTPPRVVKLPSLWPRLAAREGPQ